MIKKINFKKITQDKAFWGALIFTVLIYAIEEKLMGQPQGAYLRELFSYSFDKQLAGLLASFIAFLLLFAFIWGSVTSSAKFKVAYFTLFSTIIMAQYGYWGIFNEFMTAEDLYTAFHSPPNLWRASMTLFFNPWSLLPITLYLLLLICVRDTQKHGFRRFAEIILLIALYSTIIIYTPYQKNTGVSILKMFGTLGDAALSDINNASPVELTFHTNNPPTNNIVLIIDESVRADHLSLNGYKRPTTPYLEKMANKAYFYNWGTAVSVATCSIQSNIRLLRGATAEIDTKIVLSQYPSLFQYAVAMGYKTYYFDAQMTNLWNGLRVKDVKQMEEWITATDLGTEEDALYRDLKAADKIHQIISQSTGNFIVINKRGVHYLYEYAYPSDKTVWSPTPPHHLYREYPQLAINAYDNAILFNLNRFFQILFPDVDAPPEDTFFIYTSDHGQTLFEHKEMWPHCGNTKNEAKVPLLLMGQLKYPPDTSYKASHNNILPTILDLMNVPARERLHTYAPSLLTAAAKDSTIRRFTNRDGKVIVTFDEK